MDAVAATATFSTPSTHVAQVTIRLAADLWKVPIALRMRSVLSMWTVLKRELRKRSDARPRRTSWCRLWERTTVDAQLRVLGIENLRVADASVMPDDPSGNTNVPTMMIGEKAADLLRGRTLGPAEV
jgi:hypothetical protein